MATTEQGNLVRYRKLVAAEFYQDRLVYCRNWAVVLRLRQLSPCL